MHSSTFQIVEKDQNRFQFLASWQTSGLGQ